MKFQNDRVYCRKGTLPDPDISTIPRKKFPKKLMIWAGVAHDFKPKLPFLETHQTMNSEQYIDRVLRPVVIPASKRNNFTLQEDGTTCHTSGKTRKVLNDENVKFWEPEIWPANSPDLNPMGYAYGQGWKRMLEENHQLIWSNYRRDWGTNGANSDFP